jgi:hypothetical protein
MLPSQIFTMDLISICFIGEFLSHFQIQYEYTCTQTRIRKLNSQINVNNKCKLLQIDGINK